MLKTYLINPANKRALRTQIGNTGEDELVVSGRADNIGTFKSISQTTAGTTTLVQPQEGGGAIVLTDIILTTEKQAGGSVIVRFTDGTNNVDIIGANVNDNSCNISIPFAGHWEGWRAARIDVINTGNVALTISVGYYKIDFDKSLTYSEWVEKQ
jgi:hypothetical protein